MSPQDALNQLSRSGLRPVLEAALERYRRDGTLGRSSPALEDAAWDALSRLLGRRVRRLDLLDLDAALRQTRYGLPLLEVLQELNGGPILVQREQKSTLERALSETLQAVSDPEWRAALERGEAGASLIRTALNKNPEAQKNALLEDLRRVSSALNLLRASALHLPILAVRVADNAHALDPDRRAGKLLGAALEGLNLPAPLRDRVSSSVLVANLRGAAWLEAAAERALILPWLEVDRLGVVRAENDALHIVENPAVFEKLLEHWPEKSLLCTSGQPSHAALSLLERLSLSTTLKVCCDLDVGGLHIAARLKRRFPAQFAAWHYDLETYRTLLKTGSGVALNPERLSTLEPDFPELVATMRQYEVGFHQEQWLGKLLEG